MKKPGHVPGFFVQRDRHRTVLNPAAWQLDNFNRNGIVGYQHNVYGDGLCSGPNPDDVIGRGRAFLDVAAACVFVPGKLDAAIVERLVAGIGERKVSLIGVPGSVPSSDLQRLGVARLSFGPWSQRAVLTALQDLSGELLAGGALPEGIRPLN